MRTVFKPLFLIAAMAALAGFAGYAHAQKPVRKNVSTAAPYRGTPYSEREDAMQWADEAASRRGMDPAWTRAALGRAQMLPVVAQLMQPAPTGTPKNWQAYRRRFVEPVRIAAGLKFWKE